MNQLSAQHVLEDQILNQLQEKKMLLAKITEEKGEPERIKKLNEDIVKLQEFWDSMNEDTVDTPTFEYPRRDS